VKPMLKKVTAMTHASIRVSFFFLSIFLLLAALIASESNAQDPAPEAVLVQVLN